MRKASARLSQVLFWVDSKADRSSGFARILSGRKDLLTTHLDFEKLPRLLHGDARRPDHIKREDVDAIGAWDWV